MSPQPRPLPQSAPDIDESLTLVCSVPAVGRTTRALDVQSVLARAHSYRETSSGVTFAFDGSDDSARMLFDLVMAERACCARFRYAIAFDPQHGKLEFRVEADGDLIAPLKALDLGLASATNAVR